MKEKLISTLIVTVIVAVIVIAVEVVFYWESLRVGRPIHYAGDSYAVLSHIRAVAEGDFPLGLPKKIKRLNAPSEAWWSDFPITDLVYWIPGQFVREKNLFLVANWAVFCVLALNGIVFTWCAIALGSNRLMALVCGILFGLAPYGFVRQLEHLNLTWYFTVPLGIYIVMKLWKEEIRDWKKILWLYCLSFIIGLFNPYYIAIHFVLLGFVSLGLAASKKWKKILVVFGVALSIAGGFIFQNLDTFLLRFQEGPNPIAVSRDLWWMVKFGLYLPDMVFPKFHRSDIFLYIGGKNYHYKIPVQLAGESQTAYIGAIAIITLGILFLTGFAKLFSTNLPRNQNPFFLLSLVTFIFSVVGGLNYLLGGLGIQFLRSSNRYSLFLMALGLFALSIYLSQKIKKRSWAVSCAFILTIFGIWDQVPRYPDWLRKEREEANQLFEEDRRFFPQLEKALAEGAMIFQLPVHPYPEMGTVHRMGDYEHLRPYLHTKNLRFSYGTAKGRQHASWQLSLDFEKELKPALMELQKRNFSAILINRRAYFDEGVSLLKSLCSYGCSLMMESDSYYILKIPEDAKLEIE